MRRLCTVVAVLSLAGGAAASWYWPFGSSDDGSEPVRRLSELMEPASRLIDEASDLAADGKTQESVEKYREALGELDRIEEENPDRAASAEFATLRNKRAYVNAAIDSLLLGQVRENAKAVAVSDTTELEKRLAAEKAKARGEKTDPDKAEAGDGPRHAVWSKDGRFLFVVNELGSSVSSYAFDGSKFTRVDKKSMLPEALDKREKDGSSPNSKAAAIKLTADGRILMASNRGHDSIAFYSVDAATGRLELRNIQKLLGKFPRDFELMPGERYMIVGHKMSDEIQVYAFDRANCSLAPVGAAIPCWRPLCFKFGAMRSAVRPR